MRNQYFLTILKKMTFALMIFTLLWSAGVPTIARAAETTVPVVETYAYYTSGGHLYRVGKDGAKPQLLVSDYEGASIILGGKFLYYLRDADSSTILRVPADGSAAPTAFITDVLYYLIDGGFFYYVTIKGAIYRVPVNAAKSTEAKLVADKVDINYANFYVKQGRMFYHTLKNGKAWVVTKAADGKGQLQWIASGVMPYTDLTADSSFVYITINTKPEETETSVNCMVLYTLPLKGGVSKAINAKYPLEYNWVDSGRWLNGYYLYNKNITIDLEGEYDYTTGTGFVLGMNSKAFQLHNTGITQAVSIDATRIAFIDVNLKAYIKTIKDNKVISTKTMPLTEAFYVQNVYTKGKVTSTLFFTSTAIYKLQPDLSLKKIVSGEWVILVAENDIPGFFYNNPDDDNKLYWGSEDGKSTKSMNTDTVEELLLIAQQ